MADPQGNNGGPALFQVYEVRLLRYEIEQQELKNEHMDLLQRANTIMTGFRSTSIQMLMTAAFSAAGPVLNRRMGQEVGGHLYSWLFYIFIVSFFHALVTSVVRLRWVASDMDRLVQRNRRIRHEFSDFVDSISDEGRMNFQDRLDLFEAENDSVTNCTNGYYADLAFACLAFCAKIGLILVISQHI